MNWSTIQHHQQWLLISRTSTEDSLSERVRDIGDVGHGIRDIRDLRWRQNTRDNFINLIPQAACLAGNRFEKENLIRGALSKYICGSVWDVGHLKFVVKLGRFWTTYFQSLSFLWVSFISNWHLQLLLTLYAPYAQRNQFCFF